MDWKTKKPVSEPSWCGLGWASREKSGSFAWTTTDGDVDREDDDELAGEDSSGQEQRQERTARHDLAGVVRDDDYDDGDGNWRLGAFWVGNL